MIEAVMHWAGTEGHRRIRLDVGDANAAAITLYERLGFEPTGESFTFPPPREHVHEHERIADLRTPGRE